MSDKELKSTIHALSTEITVISDVNKEDYISLTDIARYKNTTAPKDVVRNWLRIRSTIEFLGLWETMHNPNFNRVEFDSFKNDSGANAFTLSPQQWIKSTSAIGIVSKSGKYGGGTFAHKDIAFEFASWISPEFKLYAIQDYQKLKQDENHRKLLDWNIKRLLSKTNYKIHTDAIKANLIPEEISKQQEGFIYADEADMLNAALFGKTAKDWRNENPTLKGNIRDYATIEQLLVLTNMENANAILIEQGLPQRQRAIQLNKLAISQMKSIVNQKSTNDLKHLNSQPNLLLDK